MIKKIISGGQTGADQAALDVALKLDIAHGGWIPKGRLTEEGRLPDKYQLTEMSTPSYPQRTEQNVIDSDGTLIICHGLLDGGSEYTCKMAQQHGRPWLHIDLERTAAFEAVRRISSWLTDSKIEILNVAGPRASKDPEIYQAVMDILEATIYLDHMTSGSINPRSNIAYDNLAAQPPPNPHTVEEAVVRLLEELSLKDKATIANMTASELSSLHFSLGDYIRHEFGLWSENQDLLASCRFLLRKDKLDENEASLLIIQELWKKLKETHRLRILK